ncbi:ankyrin repeat-containing protein [Echria macrotheca]|uniref:Ankyrin repeat-containing protein n=1 Tax=Echria macrotheca TaxID=438768 RepID=A0AAJ0B6M4_9PEZI|nr:ankyrin repeat-containing protein [Echria macrotheca]
MIGGNEEPWDRDAVLLGRDDVSDFNEENILPQPPEVLAKIRQWLQPTDYDSEGGEYKKHSASHLAGTGGWLFSSDAYQTWHSSEDDGLLWIRGIPGSGKSVFAASIIDHLRQEDCPILFFFFRQIIDANHRPIAAVRDMLVQLLPLSPPLQQAFKEYIDNDRGIDSITNTDLWHHLRRATVYMPRVYCVVDALDEMDQTDDLEPFLRSLIEFASWRSGQVKVVITSRPVAYIEGPLRTARALHIRLEEKQVDMDIAKFVEHKLSQSTIPGHLQDRIRAAVPGNANGLFLYARLAMDAFLKPWADITKVLEELPRDLNVMYTDLLREHSRRSGVPAPIQLLILQAVTHATRPLRLLEIADFINLTQYPPDKRDLKTVKSLVRAACGPLLEILPDETVSVVHHSLTEFLNGSTRKPEAPKPETNTFPVLESGPTHNRLGVVCLSYLVFGCFDGDEGVEKTGPSRTGSHVYFNKEEFCLRYPFAQYASQNWHSHWRKAALTGHNMSEINQLVDKLLHHARLADWASIAGTCFGGEYGLSPLSIAVRYGLDEYVGLLLGRPETDINRDIPDAGPPICLASKEGHEKIVAMLLDAGASTGAHTERGETPMLLAASHGHQHTVKFLLEQGVDPFEKLCLDTGPSQRGRQEFHQNALFRACNHGHIRVVGEIARCIKTAKQASTLLWCAVRSKRPEMVELALAQPLVQVDAEPEPQFCTGDPPISPGMTPLIAASDARNPRIIELLLQAGANPNAQYDGAFSTAGGNALNALTADRWRCAEEERSPTRVGECLRLLVAAGADTNQLDRKGNSVLHNVTDPVSARLLLDAGADPNVTNSAGQTVLHTCDNKEILEVLLAYADTDIERKQARNLLTPLLCAISRARFAVAIRLLEKGASPLAVDNRGAGVFHYAVLSTGGFPSNNPQGLAQLPGLIHHLRQYGGDANIPNSEGRTALHTYVSSAKYESVLRDNPCVLQALIAAGADVEVKDHDGRTPLYLMMLGTPSDYEARWDIFIRAGARPDSTDNNGRTLFHALKVDSNFTRLSQLYITHGLDPKQTDYEGNTLWHVHAQDLADMDYEKSEAAQGRPESLLPLIELDVDPLQPNHAGRTLLHELSHFESSSLRSWRDVREGYTRTITPPGRQHETMLTYAIQLHEARGVGVDQQDKHGVTALHISSTHSEYNVQRLLEAGADPLKATHEGLTPLHLAARSHQPNVVALLLEWLKTHHGEDVLRSAVNSSAESFLAKTPLLHACVSGTFQSVQMLLEAGARSDVANWTPLAQFETEDRKWPGYNGSTSISPVGRRRSSAVRLRDNHRFHGSLRLDYPLDRLDEILDLLWDYMPAKKENLARAIGLATRSSHDYTVEVLVRQFKKRFPECDVSISGVDSFPSEEKFSPLALDLCLGRREANRTVASSERHRQSSPDVFRSLMRLRDYDGTVDALKASGGLTADLGGLEILHSLVLGGFASILKQVATKEVVRQLDSWKTREPLARRLKDSPNLRRPLLHVACDVERPNMDVLRVLVEDLGVDVHGRDMCPRHIGQGGQKEYVPDRTVLHVLAEGRHYWQHAFAVRYLIQKGVDFEARDAAGLTPLLIALGNIGLPSFDIRMVRELVSAGANVNAITPGGRTCLGQVVSDPLIVRYLLESGARTTFSALECSITCTRPDVLEMLLDHGADPNMKETEAERERIAMLLEHGLWADVKVCETMVQLLLNHGADPNAVCPDKSIIIHRMIANGTLTKGSFANICLGAPSINLEARDANGRTLLHAACRGMNNGDGSLAILLLDRGADVRAISEDGCNALHHLNSRDNIFHTKTVSIPALRRILAAAPDLVNQKDNHGQTPLHKALALKATDAANVLLSAGADPAAADSYGNTPLHWLMYSPWEIDDSGNVVGGAYEVFTKLTAAKADVNVRNPAGETPLFWFFRSGRVKHGEAWRERHEWPVQATDPAGIAAESRVRFASLPLMRLFEEHGMDWRTTNEAGQSLLHVVVKHTDMYTKGDVCLDHFRFLMGRGVDPLLEDKEDRSALDIAAIRGLKKILAMFKRDVPEDEDEEEEEEEEEMEE